MRIIFIQPNTQHRASLRKKNIPSCIETLVYKGKKQHDSPLLLIKAHKLILQRLTESSQSEMTGSLTGHHQILINSLKAKLSAAQSVCPATILNLVSNLIWEAENLTQFQKKKNSNLKLHLILFGLSGACQDLTVHLSRRKTVKSNIQDITFTINISANHNYVHG